MPRQENRKVENMIDLKIFLDGHEVNPIQLSHTELTELRKNLKCLDETIGFFMLVLAPTPHETAESE